jgi:hypothetical protein
MLPLLQALLPSIGSGPAYAHSFHPIMSALSFVLSMSLVPEMTLLWHL